MGSAQMRKKPLHLHSTYSNHGYQSVSSITVQAWTVNISNDDSVNIDTHIVHAIIAFSSMDPAPCFYSADFKLCSIETMEVISK